MKDISQVAFYRTKSIDEWAAAKCGFDISHGEYFDIKDPRCREIVRERYRKKGWMITFTMNSVIYQLHATEQDHEAYLYCKDSEEECITAIYEAENGSEVGMSAYTNWKVKVRKSYTEIVEVSAVTSDEAYEQARNIYGVVSVEEVIWDDPEIEKPLSEDQGLGE